MSQSAECLRKYKFVKDIGEGSFGKAMLYEHKVDGQKVTVNTTSNGFGFNKKIMLCPQSKLRIFGQHCCLGCGNCYFLHKLDNGN